MISNTRQFTRNEWLITGVVLIALTWLYLPFLRNLVADWGTNENYSHGYFIPFLTIYFIYSIRDQLSRLEIKPVNSGLIVLLLGLAQLILGKIGSEFFTQRTSLIIVFYGLILFFLGWEFFKKLFFPFLYLIFMIPLPAIIWNKIAFPLQLFSSYLTEKVVSFLGIPIYREGNIIHLAQTTLEVVAACSGLRSLITMFALSAALAFLSTLSFPRKLILFLAAAPIAIFANMIRLTATAIMATRIGAEAAQGFLHESSGIVVFLLGLSLLIGVNWLLNKTKR
jgi:exosortase